MRGFDGAHVAVAQAVALLAVRREVGDHDVAPRRQPAHRLLAQRMSQVDAHAALAPVEKLEAGVQAALVGNDAARGYGDVAHRVAGLRVLDLHHVRAHVGEHGAGGGRGDPVGDFQHLYAVEQSGHGAPPWLGWELGARWRMARLRRGARPVKNSSMRRAAGVGGRLSRP